MTMFSHLMFIFILRTEKSTFVDFSLTLSGIKQQRPKGRKLTIGLWVYGSHVNGLSRTKGNYHKHNLSETDERVASSHTWSCCNSPVALTTNQNIATPTGPPSGNMKHYLPFDIQ